MPPTAPSLAELDAFMQAGGFHPVVKAAVFLVQDANVDYYKDEIPLENITFLKQVLDAAEVDGHINEAVLDLGKLSALLNTKPESKRVALHLYALCEMTIVDKKLLNLEIDFEALEQSNSTTGKPMRPIPAKVGENAPEGSIKGAALNPKRRI